MFSSQSLQALLVLFSLFSFFSLKPLEMQQILKIHGKRLTPGYNGYFNGTNETAFRWRTTRA